MRKLACFCLFGVFFASSVVVSAADPPPKTRQICNPATDPDVCVPDTFEVIFGTDKTSTDAVLEYDPNPPTDPVDVTIVTNTLTVTVPGPPPLSKVQGWSYGVIHDKNLITILEATIGGTDAEGALIGGFDATSIDIERCDDAKCATRSAGGGFLSAVVLHFKKPVELTPNQRNSICKVKYKVEKDVGTTGTTLEISSLIAAKGSPPTDINVTIDGKSKKWTTATDGWIKKKDGPGTEICNDKIDNDGDAKIDCADEDCPDGTAPCEAKETTCNDNFDNDGDGLVDGADPDCPKTEICNNKTDDDGDAKIDCADEDCPDGTAPCEAKETTCNDSFDNDGDGLVDTADPDCQVTGCPADSDWALYFGPAVTTDTVNVGAGPTYPITMRNATQSDGFQLGVKSTTAAGTTTWEFTSTLGEDPIRLIELLISDDKAVGFTPKTPNKATSTVAAVNTIEPGTAIAALTDAFFFFDLSPAVGGTGFTVGYISDMGAKPGNDKIPLTAATGTPCPVNEILKVTLGPGAEAKFNRGDADGNNKHNVLDPILIIQIVLTNLQKKYDCDDALDANDDGKLDLTDATAVIDWVFKNAPDLKPPFRQCGNDPTADTLTCKQAAPSCP